ncbi:MULTISPECIES: aspartate-alanine antiporter [unclassified Rhizobium]|uniref:aspartate-alanine antiporter n=1 Tax=unclassified Rhizobium TaxID=2613769 RepID=UPI00177B7469|nr:MULTISPECIES: aspartate-alanine antiporter [unclassified Rhizobium]MBD9445092.1 aspartate-alanine antiporter [Rhizobium sp. RHZ01]MBD9455279.1 aspartate-alanine antiporter [Rhizobium sp. RHZ02]
MIDWFFQTLRSYPEIAIFLALGFGYYFGSFFYRGLGLGAVTATLIAAVIIGQIGIAVSGPLKPTFFLMFLFAIGYGVGPQFVRGISQDGIPQALFSVLVSSFCLGTAYIGARLAGYSVGSAAGLYAGSTTISASMGLATDAIGRLGLPAEETKALLDAMPVAYAVTYIFGTMGSAIILSTIGPALLGIDLPAACKRYEESRGGKKQLGGPGTAWHRFELRAFRVREEAPIVGKTAQAAEALLPDQRVFVEGIRRGQQIIDATGDTLIQAGDVVAVAGRREVLVNLIGTAADEVDDRELLAVPIEGVDVYVTSKEVDGMTLAELARAPGARGVFLRKITRGVTATDIPIFADTTLHRGDIVNLVGRTQDIAAATKLLGRPDRATDVADVAFIGAAIAIGALLGALVYKIGSVPLTLSTAGGTLVSGLFFGWLRSVRPTFGRIPSSTVWFMNSVGLNVFIAVVGISSGPSFVAGLRELGFSLFLWGVFVTTVPLVLAMYVAKYVFRFDEAILLGCCAGARTTTAALGMINDRASSHIPALGYTVSYAVGSILLTTWGMVLVMLMT